MTCRLAPVPPRLCFLLLFLSPSAFGCYSGGSIAHLHFLSSHKAVLISPSLAASRAAGEGGAPAAGGDLGQEDCHLHGDQGHPLHQAGGSARGPAASELLPDGGVRRQRSRGRGRRPRRRRAELGGRDTEGEAGAAGPHLKGVHDHASTKESGIRQKNSFDL